MYALGIGALLAFLPAFISTQIGLRGWSDVITNVPSDFQASLAKIDPRGLSQVTAVVLLVATGIADVTSNGMDVAEVAQRMTDDANKALEEG